MVKLTNSLCFRTAKLKKLIRNFQNTLCGDARSQDRVKAVNTLLNSGHDLRILDDTDVETVWESLFFALWFAEMGRGCEEIIAAIERACSHSYRLTRTGFKKISEKWYGLDQYRVDKVSHLARHLLPVLLKHQISLWFQSCKKSKKLGTRDVFCKQLLRHTLKDVCKSYGLCYFILEILAEEISKSLTNIYNRAYILTGKFELKANLIVFIYRQIISFAARTKLDSRLVRTFDQYVIKKFVEEILINEPQLTQILVSLRFYQALDKYKKKSKRPIDGKTRALLSRWSVVVRDLHEKCINGELFPSSVIPKESTIQLKHSRS